MTSNICDPQRILTIMLCPIGDTLFSTPALHLLRQRYPRAYISALVTSMNAGILEHNPDLDDLLVFTPASGWLREVARIASIVRERSYDVTVEFSNLAGWVSWLGGIPRRIPLQLPVGWWLLPKHGTPFSSTHAIEHYSNVVIRLIQNQTPLATGDPETTIPLFWLTAPERQEAQRFLLQEGLEPGEKILTFHPGGEGFQGRKQWATDRFAEVAASLAAQYGLRPVILGSLNDRPAAEAIVQGLGQYQSLPLRSPLVATGKTSLRISAALIEASILFIGNDSCLLHIAAALGTPAIGIFGPSDLRHFAPRHTSGRQILLQNTPPCGPCFRFVGNDPLWYTNPCRHGTCLQNITPAQVLDAAEHILRDRSPHWR